MAATTAGAFAFINAADRQEMKMITTQKALRHLFWIEHPTLERRKITNYSGNGKMHVTDTRVAWCDWIDFMSKDGQILQELAQRATLD